MATTDMPRRRLRTFFRRWRLIAAAAALLAGGSFAAVLLLSGDDTPGAQAASPPSQSPSQMPSQMRINIEAETMSGLIGRNHDDLWCLFAEMAWEVRDGAGVIIAADRVAGEGASVGNSRWAAAGKVQQDPYVCTSDWAITVPVADVYQLTVTAAGGADSITFSNTGDPEILVESVTVRLS